MQAVGLVVLAVLTVIVGWLSVTSVKASTDNRGDVADQTTSATPAPGDVQARPEGSALSLQVQIAIEERDWPDFVVPLDRLESAKATEWASDACIDVREEDLERCTYDGPGDQLAVVVGDSVAISWLPGLRVALADQGYETLPLTMGQCPASHAAVENKDERQGFSKECSDYHAWASGVINEFKPDLIIASSAANSLERLRSGAKGASAEQEWRTDTAELLEAVATPDRQVVVLSPPPEGKNLQACITRFNGPSDCTSTISDGWSLQSAAERAAVERFEGSEQVAYVDTSQWFCNAFGVCPTHVRRIPVRADGNHLTGSYAQFVAPQLETALLEVGSP